MKSRYLLPILLLVTALAVACAPTAKKSAPVGRASNSDPYDFEKEGNIPPPEDIERVADVEESVVDVDDLGAEDLDAPPPPPEDTTLITAPGGVAPKDPDQQPKGPPPAEIRMAEGFRVQVFASAQREAAQTARQEVMDALSVAAYVDLIDGLFKVRVGNCKTREEAVALRDRCRRAGYQDSWVVVSSIKVKVPQKPR